MRKLGAMVVVVFGASVALAGPGSHGTGRTGDAFGGDSLRSQAVAVQAPAPSEPLPPPREEPPAPAKLPPTGPAPAATAPAAAGNCCGGTYPGTCWQHLCAWITYRPLEYGVHCEACGKCGVGACCGFHCNPSPYLYFLHPCVDGHVAPPACVSCAQSGGCGATGCGHSLHGLVGRLLHHGSTCATPAP
jgi:hypothetical protein